jgi:hypothetical protein
MLDNTFTVEQLQRFSDRHTTGPEALGEIHLPQLQARRQRTAANQLAQLIGDALR